MPNDDYAPQTRSASSRRQFLGFSAGVSAMAANMSLLDVLSQPALAEELKQKRKSVILLWLAGGASQLETWDPKPGRATGGPFSEIQTNIPGTRISELLPRMSRRLHHTAIIRSLNTVIADHDVRQPRWIPSVGYSRAPSPQ